MQRNTGPNLRRMRGFTLIEIMVVIVIIGLLAAIVAPNVIGALDRAVVQRAVTDIDGIDSAIKTFRTYHFRYPTQDEGLKILTGDASAGSEIDEDKLTRVLDRLSKDPWERDYLYRYPGEHGDFDVYTLGADGEEGGEDLDADIGNWSDDE
jgi:general secretion pathway protein G